MGVLDDLARARTDYERGDWAAALDIWSGVDEEDLGVEDLRGAAQSAYLLGRRDDAIDRYQRAFRLCEDGGDAAAGVACAFHLAMIFGNSGELAMAAGWATRAERMLGQVAPDGVEAGYVMFLHVFRHLGEGDFESAAEKANATAEIGRRHGERDLVALGLVVAGRMAIYSGRAAEGLTLLDEAMVAVAAGEVSPEVFGDVYCIAIEGCQEIAAFDRVAEWSSALYRWCSSHPGLVTYTGQCSIHRGQVMRQRGAWADALEEFTRAAERYRLANTLDAIGQAEGERGDVLRLQGEYAAAEAAYQRAGEHGFDPQPGLALLWLARGSRDAAAAAVRRLVAETGDPVGKCRVLPAAVDVLLAADAVEEARTVAAELDRVATAAGSVAMLAFSAYASGAVELASGDASGSLPYLRKSRQLWARVECSVRGRACPTPHRPSPHCPRRRGLCPPGARGRSRRLPGARRDTHGRRSGRPHRTRPTPRWSHGPRGRGPPTRRLRTQQSADRRGSHPQREDRRPPPLEHLHQAGGRLPHRCCGVRL